MLPYQIAVFGLLSWVVRPVQNDLRALPPAIACGSSIAIGRSAPRQIFDAM